MNDLSELEFECLDSIADSGALCPSSNPRDFSGNFFAIGSPKINKEHSGWNYSIIKRLYLMRILDKTSTGEYVITKTGKHAHNVYIQKKQREIVAMAAQENPDKIVLLNTFRKRQ